MKYTEPFFCIIDKIIGRYSRHFKCRIRNNLILCSQCQKQEQRKQYCSRYPPHFISYRSLFQIHFLLSTNLILSYLSPQSAVGIQNPFCPSRQDYAGQGPQTGTVMQLILQIHRRSVSGTSAPDQSPHTRFQPE